MQRLTFAVVLTGAVAVLATAPAGAQQSELTARSHQGTARAVAGNTCASGECTERGYPISRGTVRVHTGGTVQLDLSTAAAGVVVRVVRAGGRTGREGRAVRARPMATDGLQWKVTLPTLGRVRALQVEVTAGDTTTLYRLTARRHAH